jgi:hypothetical protein
VAVVEMNNQIKDLFKIFAGVLVSALVISIKELKDGKNSNRL